MNRYIRQGCILMSILCYPISLWAAQINGKVVDKQENPLIGVLITNKNTNVHAYSDKKGQFVIEAEPTDQLEILAADYSKSRVSAAKADKIVLGRITRAIQLGNGLVQDLISTTGSAGIITAEEIMQTSSLSASEALYGRGLGLTVLQNAGIPWSANNTMFVRGRNSLSSNTPLILVDGFERDMSYLVREEIEQITILKDAPATALYGLRGSNGVIHVTTKEGTYNSSQIDVSYEHGFIRAKELMKMVDGPTYASALNEALRLDGALPRYSVQELDAFKTGKYPMYYPNVNWANECLQDQAYQNIYNVNIRGGGDRVRYATTLNLQDYSGFMKVDNTTKGYSSELKSSKLNLRTNLDMKITPSTLFGVKVMGSLLEYNRPGANIEDCMSLIYSVPSIAMPIKTENNYWGGNPTWKRNPVASIAATGYGKSNSRTLYADWYLKQDISQLVKGLSAELRFAFDSYAQYWEQVSQNYQYEDNTLKLDANGEIIPDSKISTVYGNIPSPGYSSKLSIQRRHLNAFGAIDYNRKWGKHTLENRVMFLHDQYVANNQHNTYNRQRASLFSHYGYADKYFADFVFSASGSNRLQPGHKFGYYPAAGLSWVISNEEFFRPTEPVINYLKLRASTGLTGNDYVPEVNLWEQTFGSGGNYQFGAQDNAFVGGLSEQRLPTARLLPEKIWKNNVGLEMRLAHMLDITADLFYEKCTNLLVTTDGSVSQLMGVPSSYQNDGITSNKGVEIGVNFDKRWKDLYVSFGGNYTFTRNKIINQNEVYREYDYLKRTGLPIGQLFGYEAIGFFADEADIAKSPSQMFSTVMPGDIKYKDQNGDEVINSLDQVAMGYNNNCPEIYYSGYLQVEFKGIGINALFQGVGNYSMWLNNSNFFWGIRNGYGNISQHVYDNRWTPEKTNAKYPRLTALENTNNYSGNTVWLANASYLKLRTCEVYYKMPKQLLGRSKIHGVKVFVRGNDLFTWDKIDAAMDPEQSPLGYSASFSVHVGAQISF